MAKCQKLWDELAKHKVREEIAASKEGNVQRSTIRHTGDAVSDTRGMSGVSVDCGGVEMGSSGHGTNDMDAFSCFQGFEVNCDTTS